MRHTEDCSPGINGWRCAAGCEVAAPPPPPPSPPQIVDGVRFESVPQLCAAYEHALAHLAAVVALIDPGAHAWHQDQRKVQDARAFLLAAGKDVPE